MTSFHPQPAGHPTDSPEASSGPATHTQTPLLDHIRSLMSDLATYGRYLARRAVERVGESCQASRPKAAFRRASGAFQRAEWATRWLTGLTPILTGQARFTYRFRVKSAAPPLPATPNAPPAAPAPAPEPLGIADLEALFAAAETGSAGGLLRPRGEGYMRRAFATQSIGAIITRICIALDIPDTATLWPKDLVALNETPAEWSAVLHAPAPNPEPDPAAAPEPEPATDPQAATPRNPIPAPPDNPDPQNPDLAPAPAKRRPP